MCTRTKIALSVAIALGSACLSLSTYAFAGNVYDSPEWAAPLMGGSAIGTRRLVISKAMPIGPLQGHAGSSMRPSSRTRREDATDKDRRGRLPNRNASRSPCRVCAQPIQEPAAPISN